MPINLGLEQVIESKDRTAFLDNISGEAEVHQHVEWSKGKLRADSR
jgi:hypothetical protein